MTPEMYFLGHVRARREAWIDAELRRIAPHLADVDIVPADAKEIA